MKTAIVIPTYNEAENIKALIEQILEVVDANIIIVDDRSPDGTAQKIRNLDHPAVHLLEREKKRGLGSAYRRGFQIALDRGSEMIIQMDADFSHSPEAIPSLLAELENADLVIGSRHVKGGRIEGWGPWRHFCSRSAIMASRSLLGLSTKDVTSGFRAWRAELLFKILETRIKSDGYAFQEEMLFHAHRLGGEVKEYPITFLDRKAGKSKLSSKDVKEFFKTLGRLRKEYGKL